MEPKPSSIQPETGDMNMGAPELLIIIGVVVLLFGAKKLPDLARSMGQSAKEFKKGIRERGDDERPTEHPVENPPARS
jgi:sec-independent protein translocase protein TatA